MRALAVRDHPRLPPARRGVTLASYPDAQELELELTEALAAVVADALGDGAERLERRLVRPAEVGAALDGACLLVLAAGTGLGADLLTGSPRRLLTARARCPVVLVPTTAGG